MEEEEEEEDYKDDEENHDDDDDFVYSCSGLGFSWRGSLTTESTWTRTT